MKSLNKRCNALNDYQRHCFEQNPTCFFPFPNDVATERTLYLQKLNIQLHSHSLKEYGQKSLLNYSAWGDKKKKKKNRKSRMIPENMPYA